MFIGPHPPQCGFQKGHAPFISSGEAAERKREKLRGRVITEIHRERIRQSMLGVKHTDVRRKNESRAKAGIPRKNPEELLTPVRERIRGSKEYQDWRMQVYIRDGFTCVECKDRGTRLHADHIKPFSLFPELRLEISNGRTLCVPCHRKTPTYGKSCPKTRGEYERLIICLND